MSDPFGDPLFSALPCRAHPSSAVGLDETPPGDTRTAAPSDVEPDRARAILLAALDHGCQPSHCTLIEAATRAARIVRDAFGHDSASPREKCPACHAIRCRLFGGRWCCVSCRRVWSQSQIDAFHAGTLCIEPVATETAPCAPATSALDFGLAAGDTVIAGQLAAWRLTACRDAADGGVHLTRWCWNSRSAEWCRVSDLGASSGGDFHLSADEQRALAGFLEPARARVAPFTRTERKTLQSVVHMARRDRRITNDHCSALEELIELRSADRAVTVPPPAPRRRHPLAED